jgi:hypothetical protein
MWCDIARKLSKGRRGDEIKWHSINVVFGSFTVFTICFGFPTFSA